MAGETNDAAAPHCCGACKSPMLDSDGKPRELRFIVHNCSWSLCKSPVHSAVICKKVWMPTTRSGRTFCSEDHLRKYNDEQEQDRNKLPIVRIDPGALPPPESPTASDDEHKLPEPPLPEPPPVLPPVPEPTPVPQPTPPVPVPLNSETPPELMPPASAEPLPMSVGMRVQCNFAPTASSWYGGVVGLVGPASITIGFDDGELRTFTTAEVAGMTETGVLKPMEADGGLVNNERLQDRAVAVTACKDGRSPAPKPVGVLVGEHKHGVGTVPLYSAHFVDVSAFEPAPSSRLRRKSAASVKADRKGYHSFRCGDMMRSTHSGSSGEMAMMFGVVVSNIRDQMRRALILCELTDATTIGAFFVSSWTQWTRVPPNGVQETMDFDEDDDEKVETASPALIDAAIKVQHAHLRY
eukprot:6204387-Pleurochrysis_carterae.AAC.2